MTPKQRHTLKVVGLGLLSYIGALLGLYVAVTLAVAVVWQDYLEHLERISTGIVWVFFLIWLPTPVVGGYVSGRIAGNHHARYGFATGFLGNSVVIVLGKFEMFVFDIQMIAYLIGWMVLGGFMGAAGAMVGSRKKSVGHA